LNVADEASQRLIFSLAGTTDGEVSAVRAEWRRAGEDRTLLLVDDGSDPADVAWDGVWTATDVGAYVQDATVRLVVTDLNGMEHPVYAGVMHARDARETVFSWRLYETDGGLRALEVPTALPGASLIVPEAVDVYVGAAWACLLCALVAGLVHAARRDGIGW
jgi:hypothetical protein